MLTPIEWTGRACRLLDQTRLPTELAYLDITDERQMADAIRRLAVRGAPAIGIAAAFGAYLAIANHGDDVPSMRARLKQACDLLAASRPTAVNLFWALRRIQQTAAEAADLSSDALKHRLLHECLAMLEEDHRVCRAIGEHGLRLLLEELVRPDRRPIGILTHCNAGALATGGGGTALAPIYVGRERGVHFHVWADETRPLLQGARITAMELRENGVPVTLICDNMAAAVMAAGKIDAVLVGTDRVAANGDVANKIGTLGVAILARHFGIAMLVAAPTSSIDLSLSGGERIPIEQRDAREVTEGFGRRTAPEGVEVFNPAFDVTPAELVTGIITERGLARPPYRQSLAGFR